MRGIAVAILTEHREQQLPIQNGVEATRVARIMFSHPAFPLSATDWIIRQIQDLHAEVVVVDLHPETPQRALDAIELIQATTSDIAIFAMGETSNPRNIVAAMQAGACEYVDRQASNEVWLDAFARFSAERTKKRGRTCKTRVFTVINAKGGAGSTTVAVNTAVALHSTTRLLADLSSKALLVFDPARTIHHHVAITADQEIEQLRQFCFRGRVPVAFSTSSSVKPGTFL